MTSPQDVARLRSPLVVEPLLALIGHPLALIGSTISFVCAMLSLVKLASQLPITRV